MRSSILALTILAMSDFSYGRCDQLLVGINLAGAEFSPTSFPGISGVDYKFPTVKHIEFYRNIGFNAIRLPILWERIQKNLYDELDVAYTKEIESFLIAAERSNMKVVIDLHNYGKYKGKKIGVDIESFAFKDVWGRIASRFSRSSNVVAYGLMNEPNDPTRIWHRVAQFGIDGIREHDRNRTIYVGGDGWSNAVHWVPANPYPFVYDVVGKIQYEVHLYLDNDSSGRYIEGAPSARPDLQVQDRITPFFDWLHKHKKSGVIGEFGVPSDDPRWFAGVQKFYEIAHAKCIDTYYWAGGSFGPNNNLSLEPKNGKSRALTDNIRFYIGIN